MKALIVDDEKHVRDAIKMLVDWKHYQIDEIFEAPEGASAINLIIAEEPEIIFTDMMMPIKGGVELLEWIHHNKPQSKTIVISGHDDFGYMRHTIKYGGMDYILKPIDAEELNEALQKAVESWQKEEKIRFKNQDQSIKMNQIKPVYWDSLFSKLIQEPRLYPSILKELKTEFDLSENTKQIKAAILSMDTIPHFINEKYASNRDLLFFSLANIANEFLKKESLGYAFRHRNRNQELVLISWNNLEVFSKCIEAINDGIYQTLGGRFDFGIGTPKKFPMGITDSYKEAQAALKQRNLLEVGMRIHIFTNKEAPPMNSLHFNNHEEKIRLTLYSNHETQVKAVIDDWFHDVKKLNMITTEQLKLWWHEYTVFRSRCLKEAFSDGSSEEVSYSMKSQYFIIPVDEHGRLSLEAWQDEFTQSMLTLSALIANQQKKDNNVIYEIAEYILHHYHEDITLQHISERFFLSREYISRKFKQELEENISDYIGRIRIEKAKLLLLNPHLRIVQISEMVGYQDEKYFSKVFKKIIGVSPNQYRKQNDS
jgi:two-component system response regulator YesN